MVHDLRFATDLARIERELKARNRRALEDMRTCRAPKVRSIRYRVPFVRRPALDAIGEGAC